MRATIDSSKCQGHGRCAMTAPDVFDVDDGGYGIVLIEEIPADLEAETLKAVGNCPEAAISVS